MSIRPAAGWALLVLAALATGVLAIKPVMRTLMERSAIHDGPWRTTLTAGASNANFYERAAIAIAGLYALGKQETIYYTAFTDSDGKPLDGRCTYTLIGRALPARWWSFTMYGEDNYLVPNAANVYSVHAGNASFVPGGGFLIVAGGPARPRNWLPAPPHGGFSITARLYNPEADILADLAKVDLPGITQQGCEP